MLWILMACLLFIVQIAVVAIVEYRRPEKAVTWLVIMFMIPPIGFLLYYFVARNYSCHGFRGNENSVLESFETDLMDRIQSRIPKEKCRNILAQQKAILQTMPSSPLTACNETAVYADGEEAFEAMLESIAKANHHIHIEFYIIRDDNLGFRFEQLLIRKAREGVEVRLLYDGIGSRRLGRSFLNRLRRAGVETGCFFPPLTTFLDKRINYRNHRKIVVVDGKTAYFGGMNLGDEYMGGNPKFGYWRDTHFRMQGDAVLWIQYAFLADWHLVAKQWLTAPVYYPSQCLHGNEFVQIVKSDPDETMLELMFNIIVAAKKRVYIETPYFIPHSSVLMAIKTAVKRGVDVRIIVPGKPDKKLVYHASLSYVQELLQAGVRFYRYQKGFLHAKVLISDNLACSGSANMDMRSFCGQFELNAVFFDEKVVKRLIQDFHADLNVSGEIMLQEFMRRPKIQRMKEVFARLLSPLF